jgi:hypothetical protein
MQDTPPAPAQSCKMFQTDYSQKVLNYPKHQGYTLPHTSGAPDVTSVVRTSCREAAWIDGAAEDTIAKDGQPPPPEDTTVGEGVDTEPG